MKLVSYLKDEQDHLGVVVNGKVYDIDVLHPDMPTTMGLFLNYWEEIYPVAVKGIELIESGRIPETRGLPLESVQLLAPVPYPTSCRDGYAFRQHVAAAR